VIDEQLQEHEVRGPPEGALDRWGDPIGEDRAAELAAMLYTWVAEGGGNERPGPFAGVRLTGADVFRLAASALAGTEGSVAAAEQRLLEYRVGSERTHAPDLSGLDLTGADLRGAHLEQACLRDARLASVNLSAAHLQQADLSSAKLDQANLFGAHLEGADLSFADVTGAVLAEADLAGAHLRATQLERSNCRKARLNGADLRVTRLAGADLRRATLDERTRLEAVILTDSKDGPAALGDVRWSNADLTQVDWRALKKLGDERFARGFAKSEMYLDVVRGYRQLARALRAQGMNERADRYAHRAHVRLRKTRLRQFRLLRYAGSWLLALLAGYGYRPGRVILAYLLVVGAFAAAYFELTAGGPALSWSDALIASVTAFHGRGFFPTTLPFGGLRATLATGEALVGLLMEIGVVIAFIQRYLSAR
jgi:uncharacterized protein YjbI with pentapeptide repeats